MNGRKHRCSGTAEGSVILLIVVSVVILCIVRYFWLKSTNDHYHTLISAYISERQDYGAEDKDKLRAALLENGIFIKMHRWDKEGFVKDRKLYDEMTKAYKERRKRRIDERDKSIDGLINL